MMTLSRALAWWARSTPETLAVAVGEERISFAELDGWANRIAAYLIERGVLPGDRVAVLASHAVELCALFYGTIRARAIIVPIGLRLTPYEIAGMIEDFKPRLTFSDDESRSKVSDREVLPLADLRQLREAQTPAALDEAQPSDTVLIVCTSGSTARPKGVMLTHASILASVTQYVLEMPEMVPGAATLHVAPMSVSASSLQMLINHAAGLSLFFESKFDERRALQLLVEYRMPLLGLAPLFWERMVALPEFETADLSALKSAWSGGARFPAQLLEGLKRKGIMLRQMYGITECGGMATIMSAEGAALEPNKCGCGRIFNTIRIVDEDGNDVPPNTPGEIILQTPDMMQGYWNNPTATAEALRDGWLYTGDVGVFDHSRILSYVDRKKDIIVSGGLKIAAAEIEHVIADFPGVEEVAAIAAADSKFGETPMVIVYAPKGIDISALIEHCDERLASYKIPRYVVLSAEPLPRLAAGKISKPALRDQYLGAEATLERVR